MAEAKETTKNKQEAAKETPVGTNPLTLPWPQDPQGQLRDLKSGGVKAARRVNGNREKLEKFMSVLDILKKHAIARYKMDVEARKESRDNAVAARARVAERHARQAEAKAAEYEAAAKRVRREAGLDTSGK